MRAGVALEAAAGVRAGFLSCTKRGGRGNLADGLADFIGGGAPAEPVRIAHGLAVLGVMGDERDRLTPRKVRGNAADRSRLAFGIVERKAAFSRRVEFKDLRNPKAFFEGMPDVWAKAVAAGNPQAMPLFARVRRRLQEVAAELADILEQSAVEADDVVPELARGELFAGSVRSRH